jgi:hypothetical protein
MLYYGVVERWINFDFSKQKYIRIQVRMVTWVTKKKVLNLSPKAYGQVK